MKTFKVKLEFIDEDNDLIQKELELSFISQRFINRATEIFASISQLHYYKEILNNADEYKEKINDEYKGAEKVKALNNLRINLKECKKSLEELATSNFYKKKLTLIMDILKKNSIKDDRFYNFEFWDENVDPQEIQDFLEDLISRGKKKELEKSLKQNLKPLTESRKEKENIT